MITSKEESKVYELNIHGKTNLIKLIKTNYIMAPDKLAVRIFCWNEKYKYWEARCTLTVNTEDQPLNKNCAFIDINNNKDIIGWISRMEWEELLSDFQLVDFVLIQNLNLITEL